MRPPDSVAVGERETVRVERVRVAVAERDEAEAVRVPDRREPLADREEHDAVGDAVREGRSVGVSESERETEAEAEGVKVRERAPEADAVREPDGPVPVWVSARLAVGVPVRVSGLETDFEGVADGDAVADRVAGRLRLWLRLRLGLRVRDRERSDVPDVVGVTESVAVRLGL